MERWRAIFDGAYEISDLGRFRRAKPGRATWVGRPLRPTLNKANGYLYITLYIYGSKRLFRVNVLVAKVFLGPSRGRDVNHEDTVKTNNRLTNLKYLTKKRHVKHSMANGLLARGERHGSKTHPEKLSRGEHRYNHKLNEEIVRFIRASALSDRKLAVMFGVVKFAIRSVRNRLTWKHVI